MDSRLSSSAALWNRDKLNLESDETLAQLLDRGELSAWRALYRLAREDEVLRKRIVAIVARVPIGLPRFWQAAMQNLGEAVDFDSPLPVYDRDWI